MKSKTLSFVFFCLLFFVSCEKRDGFSDQFIVTYLGTANPCTGQQIRFEERDFRRLRNVLADPDIQHGWFGTLNLGDSFQAGQKIQITIRTVTPDEYQVCPALYLMLRQIYVVDAIPYR